VSKIRATDGANLGTFVTGANADGIAFDGSNIWVANSFSNTLSKIRASDGVNLGTFATGANPAEVAFDGVNIWIPNSGGDNISKY
jgi:DNA-binding beta-propeller fold protein YncE